MNAQIPPSLPLSREEKSPLDKGDLGDFLPVATLAAQAAGEILREQYTQNLVTRHKADNTEVSEADLAAEKIILETIREHFPDHGIFSEEAGSKPSQSEYLWVIDPLDGSTNFLRHLGNFCTIVSVTKNKQPLAHALYSPLTDELFTAAEGEATLNGKPITPSDNPDLKFSLVAIGRSSLNFARHGHIYEALNSRVRSVRMLGSTALQACYAASGRFEGLMCSDIKLYDILAAAEIAKAAGMWVTDFAGNPWQPNFQDPTSTSDILISNPHIHSDLVAALKNL